MNVLQFSWHNTLIDPTSVEFRPLEHRDKIELLHTVYPGDRPQYLSWHIRSEHEGQAKVEVLYFTSGITWSMDYVAVVDPDEERMKFDGFVRVFNRSGEDYADASIRLIVGEINLVEKIADLARRRGIEASEDFENKLRKEVLRSSMETAGRARFKDAEEKADLAAERQIVKEGLSEYFMFEIEGTETVPNGWSKRMRAVKAEDVKFDILYRLRVHQYGERPVRFFIWKNDKEYNLGDSPLPDGRIRIFRDNGSDGLTYLGEQNVNYVPIQSDIEINLGPDDFVVYKTVKMGLSRSDFTFARRHGRPGEDIDDQTFVAGWDLNESWVDNIRNYHDKPIKFELRRVWRGDVEYSSTMETTLFDYQTVEAAFTVPARGKVEYPAEVITRMGNKARKSRIILK